MILDDSYVVVVVKHLFCTLGTQGPSELHPGIAASEGIIPHLLQCLRAAAARDFHCKEQLGERQIIVNC